MEKIISNDIALNDSSGLTDPFAVVWMPAASGIYCLMLFYLVVTAKSLGMASAPIGILALPIICYGILYVVQMLFYQQVHKWAHRLNYPLVALFGYFVHFFIALAYLWLEGVTLFVLCIFITSLIASLGYLGFQFGSLTSIVLGVGPLAAGMVVYLLTAEEVLMPGNEVPVLFLAIGILLVLSYSVINQINRSKRIEFEQLIQKQKHGHQLVAQRNAEIIEQGQRLYEANEQLKRLSMVDGLTDIANRRRFDEFLEVEWRRAETELTPGRRAQQKQFSDHANLSLILIDVDHFKAYNDTYGHIRGDEVLQKIAAAISAAAVRPSDLTARYGGEEFVVVLPHTGPSAAFHVAERIRKAVSSLSIENRSSHTSPNISVSLGVADMVSANARTATELIDCCDIALYQAKSAGRNRTLIYRDDGDPSEQ